MSASSARNETSDAAQERRLFGRTPFLVAAAAVSVLLLVAAFQPKPITAEVLRVRTNAFMVEVATVSWLADDGTTRTEFVELPTGYEPGNRMPIWPGEGATPTRYGEPLVVVTPGLLVAVAAVAFLFGLVVDLSLRGYGFVRTGPMKPEEVEESRGFYWRS